MTDGGCQCRRGGGCPIACEEDDVDWSDPARRASRQAFEGHWTLRHPGRAATARGRARQECQDRDGAARAPSTSPFVGDVVGQALREGTPPGCTAPCLTKLRLPVDILGNGTAGEHRAFTAPELVPQDAALRPRVEANALISLARAWWQSGDAADCKSANAGSIPAQASSQRTFDRRPCVDGSALSKHRAFAPGLPHRRKALDPG